MRLCRRMAIVTREWTSSAASSQYLFPAPGIRLPAALVNGSPHSPVCRPARLATNCAAVRACCGQYHDLLRHRPRHHGLYVRAAGTGPGHDLGVCLEALPVHAAAAVFAVAADIRAADAAAGGVENCRQLELSHPDYIIAVHGSPGGSFSRACAVCGWVFSGCRKRVMVGAPAGAAVMSPCPRMLCAGVPILWPCFRRADSLSREPYSSSELPLYPCGVTAPAARGHGCQRHSNSVAADSLYRA